jgi:hypothetical protein
MKLKPTATHGVEVREDGTEVHVPNVELMIRFASRNGVPAHVTRTRKPNGEMVTCVEPPPIRRASSSSASPRARRASSPRRRGSRRSSSSSRTSGTDPGDDDPEPARVCGGCDKPLIGYAPQARFHGDTCRMRARRRALRPARPTWPEAEIVAAAMAIEPLPVLAALMQEPPGGPVAHRRQLGRDWRTGPGRGHRAPVRYDQMAVAA